MGQKTGTLPKLVAFWRVLSHIYSRFTPRAGWVVKARIRALTTHTRESTTKHELFWSSIRGDIQENDLWEFHRSNKNGEC